MTKLRVLDLFSGIGGFSLGLERTGGFETVAFCEIEPYCRKVLAKHWPGVKCYDDVQSLSAAALCRDGIAVDVITGGFPCQDISFAGKGAGIEGERSGLWGEYARLIGELRPQYVIVENVAALLVRGLGRVLGDLAALGYDAEWHCIPAAYVGAPHRRDRIWIIAYPQHSDADDAGSYRAALHFNGNAELRDEQVGEPRSFREAISTADAYSRSEHDGTVHAEMAGAPQPVSDADVSRLEGRDGGSLPQRAGECTARTSSASVAQPDLVNDDNRRSGTGALFEPFAARLSIGEHWLVEPDVGRVAHGVPRRVDRLKALGNSVVPQIPELIGRAILAQLPTDLSRREAAE
jgi:DNA (cytosine-5)-methyltransferase 1